MKTVLRLRLPGDSSGNPSAAKICSRRGVRERVGRTVSLKQGTASSDDSVNATTKEAARFREELDCSIQLLRRARVYVAEANQVVQDQSGVLVRRMGHRIQH